MILLFDLAAIIITTLITITVVSRIYSYGFKNIIAVCEVAFYVIQVVPLIIGLFIDYAYVYPSNMSNVILAVSDLETGIIYDVFIVGICLVMYFFSRHEISWSLSIDDVTHSSFFIFLCYLGMLSPIIAIILAPHPSVYLTYSYFYTHSYNTNSEEYLYHNDVMITICMISLIATILFYYIKYNAQSTKFIVTASIMLIVWCQGKRSYLAISLVAILFVDFLKRQKRAERRKIFYKALIFAIIILAYFLVYREIVGKGSELPIIQQYELYFSRMSAVKTAIYATLKNDSMMAYPGQSFVYDFLFFIPRRIWPEKPILFTRYYTAYAHGLSYGSLWGGGNLLTNIWVEHIANFGFWGIITALVYIYIIVYISEHSKNNWAYLTGLYIVVMYCVNAFSGVTMYMFYIWLALNIYCRIRPMIKHKIRIKIIR